MANFDELNRQTRDFNSRNVDRFNRATPKYGCTAYGLNYCNNQTFKTNNGQFSSHYF